jgi:hypothetical protein
MLESSASLLGIRFWEALAPAGAGWLLRALLDTLLSRPLGGVRLWLWRAASGQPTRLRPTEVLPRLLEQSPPDPVGERP